MMLEVTNALWKALKQKRISKEDAQEALKMLDDLHVEFLELNWLHASQTLTAASKLDLAVYDAAYLFLSDQTGACLITADNKLYEKAKGHFQVLHLKDY
jgi:predicted nucleic acid-binding protein